MTVLKGPGQRDSQRMGGVGGWVGGLFYSPSLSFIPSLLDHPDAAGRHPAQRVRRPGRLLAMVSVIRE